MKRRTTTKAGRASVPGDLKSINIAPTWSGILPALLALLEASNAEGRATARAELSRMAGLADRYVAAQEVGKPKRSRAR